MGNSAEAVQGQPAPGRGRGDRHRHAEPRGLGRRPFPEIREAAEAAVKLINEKLGGVGADLEAGTPGRPIKLEVCAHKIDQAEAQACATTVKEANPNLIIVGIDFFTPLMYPVWEGIPIMETVPIFVADFDQPGVVSAFGGCVSAFPGAALYAKEVKKADRVAVIHSDNAPGQQCYADTQKRFYEYLEVPHQPFPDKPGDPSDNDANVQAVINYLDGAENPVVTFGIQASDCAEYIKALDQAGYEGALVPAGSCVDESVYTDPRPRERSSSSRATSTRRAWARSSCSSSRPT